MSTIISLTFELQHSSLIKTVAKKVNSFHAELFVTIVALNYGDSFYHFATPLRASTRYVWIGLSVNSG